MSKKLFFFDIDGTICRENHVSERVKKAINDRQAKGDLCFVASGRPLTFLQDAVKDIGFDGYLLFNGAYVIANNEVIHEVVLNPDDLKEILDYLRKTNSEYILQNANFNYIHKDHCRLFNFYRDLVKVNVNQFIREFNEDEVLKNHLLKVEIWPDHKELCDKIVERFPNYKWHIYESHNMELCLKDISKAWGIEKIMKHYHIKPENTYCFGDGGNDIEMFQTVYNSYAMGNAEDHVKAYAKNVCPSIEDDGVAIILESLI